MTSQPPATSGPGFADYGLLLLLSAIWGSSFLFIKVAVETMPAVSMTAARLTLAGLILVAMALLSKQPVPKGKSLWGWILMAALFGNALPFALIGWGEEKIDSGLAAILMAVMPLTTLVLAHIFTKDEKITWPKAIGVVLGFTGLIVLIGPAKLASLGEETVRQLAVAGAAVCYGINAIITKQFTGLPPRSLAAAVVMTSALMLIPATFVFDTPHTLDPSLLSGLAIAGLAVLHTVIATLLLFTIVRRQGAAFFSQINYLVPPFGVAWGAILLAERPSPNAYVALALILVGIAIAGLKFGRTPNKAS
ncbi:MAG: DMT family transporter [Pseudomonadota bacterium]